MTWNDVRAALSAVLIGVPVATAQYQPQDDADISARRVAIDEIAPRVVDAMPSALGIPFPVAPPDAIWDNGPADLVTAHLAQRSSTGDFLTADDCLVKEGFFACIESATFCFLVSDSIDGAMIKPTFALNVHDDCDGRPGPNIGVYDDPTKIAATLLGPSPFPGFNLWTVQFIIDDAFVTGYERPWFSPHGIGELQQASYYWISANRGVIQGAQAQIKNGAQPWQDVQTCNCPDICTDMYFFIEGRRCCLAKDNSPHSVGIGEPSLQLFGANIDTARAADNFQIAPHASVALCRVEAWMATNCPLDKVFLEIYENDCDCPANKIHTIDITDDLDGDGLADQPIFEDTGSDYLNCNIYKFTWTKISGITLDPGKNYWLSVVARSTGSILDKAYWMRNAGGSCVINISEGKVKDPAFPGMEDWIPVSQDPRGIISRDYAFKLYTDATPPVPVGSCCFVGGITQGPGGPFGICQDQLADSDCSVLGGVWTEGQLCQNNPCASVFGACCLPNMNCTEIPEGACVSVGGSFLDIGLSCSVADCEALFGACCLDDGGAGLICQDLLIQDCLGMGGVFDGEGTSCTNAPCVLTFSGACCLDDPMGVLCVDTLDPFCNNAGGVFNGPGTSCAAGGCAALIGACCTGDVTQVICTDTLDVFCENLSGFFNGPGTSCAAGACAALSGACCFVPNKTDAVICTDTLDAFCAQQNATFAGPGTSCANDACAQFVGACCLPTGDCLDFMSPATCQGVGGDYQGDGSDCNTAICLIFGACCLSAAPCQLDVTEDDCTLLGGQFLAVESDCLACEAMWGSCCLGVGLSGGAVCNEALLEDDCVAAGGAFLGAGSNCAGSPCDQFLGACCIADATCMDALSDSECISFGGTFTQGATCADACPTACCLPFDPVRGESVCQLLTVPDCTAIGGTSSPGQTCETACLGACCVEDDLVTGGGGNCLDGVSEDLCESLLGSTFYPGQMCIDVPCDEPDTGPPPLPKSDGGMAGPVRGEGIGDSPGLWPTSDDESTTDELQQ